MATDRSGDANLPGAADLGQSRVGRARLVYRRGGEPAAARRANRRDRVSLAGRPGRETHAARLVTSAFARGPSFGGTGSGGGLDEGVDEAPDRRRRSRSRGESARAQRQAARRRTSAVVRLRSRKRATAGQGGRMNKAGTFEYEIRKDFRNNQIVREVDERRLRDLWPALVVVRLFSAGQHFELLRHGYRLEQMQRERAAESDINRHLRLEIETLQAPQRIEKLATDRLGMVAPGDDDAVVLERVVPPAPPGKTVVAAR